MAQRERVKELIVETFTQIPNEVLDSQVQLGLSSSALNLYLHIRRFKYGDSAPFPSVGTLAQRMGVSERCVQKLEKELESIGLIRRQYISGRTTQFEVVYPRTVVHPTPEPQFTPVGVNHSSPHPRTTVHPKNTCLRIQDQKITADAVPVLPERTPLRRTRTPKPETGDAFVAWVDATFPSVPTRKAWGRYVKAVNSLLADRRRENPTGAYSEVVDRFERLMAGEFDSAFPWNDGRTKDISGFVQFYQNLGGSENGRARGDLKCPICSSPGHLCPDGRVRCSGKEIHGWTP